MSCRVVDLPAPLGPRNPVTFPGSTQNDSPSTARLPPNSLVRPMASIRMAVTSAYSVAMAVSTSVLAARLAGQAAASSPTAPSPARATQQLPDRHGRVQQPGPQGGPLEHRAEQVAAAD